MLSKEKVREGSIFGNFAKTGRSFQIGLALVTQRQVQPVQFFDWTRERATSRLSDETLRMVEAEHPNALWSKPGQDGTQ